MRKYGEFWGVFWCFLRSQVDAANLDYVSSAAFQESCQEILVNWWSVCFLMAVFQCGSIIPVEGSNTCDSRDMALQDVGQAVTGQAVSI